MIPLKSLLRQARQIDFEIVKYCINYRAFQSKSANLGDLRGQRPSEDQVRFSFERTAFKEGRVSLSKL